MTRREPAGRLRLGLGLVVALALVACSTPEASSPQPAPSPEPSTSSASAAPSPTPSPTSSPEASPTPTPGRPPRVRHVVVVSLDGLGSGLINLVGFDNLPTINTLTRDGAHTFNARTEVEQTVTLPNHAGMLTGRPVAPSVGGHGVMVNVDTGQTVHDLAGERVVSVFDVVHDSGGSTALFTTKDKFELFQRSWPDAIDEFTTLHDSRSLMAAATADLLDARRTFTFVHLGLIDDAGHAAGWGSPAQQVALRQADALVGDLIEAVSSDRKLSRRLVFVITADHGGTGTVHSDASDPRNYTVPFWVLGRPAEKGTDLYLVNPHLADPGTGRPPYDAPRSPVRNGFVANLVTDLLRLGPVPGSVLNTSGLSLGTDCDCG